MLIAIISDTHLGVKNSSDIFLNYQKKFFDEVFFPYCVMNDIKKVIHLGDFFEHRKYVSIKVLHWARTNFFDKLAEHGMTMDIFPGNHDVVFRSTNDMCALKEVHDNFPKVVTVHMEPIVKNYDGLDLALLPWITVDNYSRCMDFIATAPAPILLGHLELSGFEMMKGQPVVSHGLDAALFKRYESVLTGHYHTKSTRGNIHYLGTQYELTWSDNNDPKYFHTLNTATRELKPIRNPHTIFNKIVYKDNPKQKFSFLKGTYVKVIVTSKKDPKHFDTFIDRIQREEPHELKIVESFDEFIGSSVDDDDISLEDTGTLLTTYVDAIETELDKERLKTLLHELYTEAQTLDAV